MEKELKFRSKAFERDGIKYLKGKVGVVPYMTLYYDFKEKFIKGSMNVAAFRSFLMQKYQKEFYRDMSWLEETLTVHIVNNTPLDEILEINKGYRDLMFVYDKYFEIATKLNVKVIVRDYKAVCRMITKKYRRNAQGKVY